MKLRQICFLFFLAILSFSNNICGQSPTIDSLKLVLSKAKSDSLKLIVMGEIIGATEESKVWAPLNEEMMAFAKKILSHNPSQGLKRACEISLALGLSNKGYLLLESDEPNAGLRCFLESAAVQEKLGEEEGYATAIANIAYTYNILGDVPKALEYNFKALKIRERHDDNKKLALILNNIALIYSAQGQHEKAIENLKKTLSLYTIENYKQGLLTTYNNLGFVYSDMRKLDLALENYLKSLKISEEEASEADIGLGYGNIALVYRKKLDYPKAMEYAKKSLEISRRLGLKRSLVKQLNNLSYIYNDLGKFEEAIKLGEEGYKIAKELGYPNELQNVSRLLYTLYKKRGNAIKALAMHEEYILMRDSILNEKTRKSSIQSQFQYTYDKKSAADSIKNVEEKKVTDARIAAQKAQLKQERTQRFALFGGLGLLVIFSVFFYNRFKITQKQKSIIENQKHLVDEKNEELNQQNEEIAAQRDEIEKQKELIEEHQKEVTDSILYARRIQQALLASDKLLNTYLKNHFVFFQPKDIVSGDFYWATQAHNKFYYVIADSTGHGVPGAFMSLLNISFLNEAITDKQIESPAEILNHVRSRLMVALQDDGSEEGGKDGMDCILLVFDFKNNMLDFACANNALMLIRDNEIKMFNADRMPVGRSPRQEQLFTNQTLKLQKGDCIYAYTDGYADQFGGPKGKKFKYKPLEEMLLKTNPLPANEQTQILKNTIENWKGNLEQVDDILVVGIRV